MVYFIAGSVCSGKSTQLLKVYNDSNCGDGFYNVRRIKNNQSIGQDLVQMSTEKSIPFSRVRGYIPDDWDECASFANYSFSKKGIEFAENIIDIILENHKVAFIDELGPLELKKMGLYSCFKKLLQSNIDIYVVCRSSCITPILNTFNIENYII